MTKNRLNPFDGSTSVARFAPSKQDELRSAAADAAAEFDQLATELQEAVDANDGWETFGALFGGPLVGTFVGDDVADSHDLRDSVDRVDLALHADPGPMFGGTEVPVDPPAPLPVPEPEPEPAVEQPVVVDEQMPEPEPVPEPEPMPEPEPVDEIAEEPVDDLLDV